jgi:hypothetical protein
MKLYMEITPENLIDSVVTVTSLCENNTSQIDMTLRFDTCIESDMEKFMQSLKKYDNLSISISDSKHISPDAIFLPSCMIVDGDITKICNDIASANGEKTLYDYGINAPFHHDNGLSYEDFKSKYSIIFYPEDKPYHCSNVHYDLERIWWEYARMTPIIAEIKKTFLECSLSDTSLELYAMNLVTENKDISEAIDNLKSRIEQIS